MLIIQHRANSLHHAVLSDAAEIDVHLTESDGFIVKHNIDECGWELSSFLERTRYKKFFVDIKQNLEVEHYRRLVKLFGDRLIGLFDVPFPSAYYAEQAGLPIYHRFSEVESPFGTGFAEFRGGFRPNKIWFDPLMAQDDCQFGMMFLPPHNVKMIVACPSLHGHPFDSCIKVWNFIRERTYKLNIEGIVTKHTTEAQEFFNDYSRVYLD